MRCLVACEGGTNRPEQSALLTFWWGGAGEQELERLDSEIHDRFFSPSTIVAQTVTG